MFIAHALPTLERHFSCGSIAQLFFWEEMRRRQRGKEATVVCEAWSLRFQHLGREVKEVTRR